MMLLSYLDENLLRKQQQDLLRCWLSHRPCCQRRLATSIRATY